MSGTTAPVSVGSLSDRIGPGIEVEPNLSRSPALNIW